jgi:hypothetical protein
MMMKAWTRSDERARCEVIPSDHEKEEEDSGVGANDGDTKEETLEQLWEGEKE